MGFAMVTCVNIKVGINNNIDECDTNGVRYFASPHIPHWYGQPRTTMETLTSSFLGKGTLVWSYLISSWLLSLVGVNFEHKYSMRSSVVIAKHISQ